MAFSLKSRIARGRTVETFSARLSIDGEEMDVAVKKLRPELAENQAFVAAFLKWAEEQKSLDHENLVGIFEAGVAPDGGAYVIEERVEGASLGEIIAALTKRRRSIRIDLATYVALRTAKALSLLHEREVVHGALDPNAIFVSYS